jgi:hypothetical protein
MDPGEAARIAVAEPSGLGGQVIADQHVELRQTVVTGIKCGASRGAGSKQLRR